MHIQAIGPLSCSTGNDLKIAALVSQIPRFLAALRNPSMFARRRVRSDWMAVERERSSWVSSAVMSFEHEGLAFDLVDTPDDSCFPELRWPSR